VFRRVIAGAPDYAPAHSNLGNVLFAQGKLAEAEAAYRRARAIRPDMLDAPISWKRPVRARSRSRTGRTGP
jgi:cytochrome c-type biogenesis protein CcmH/NrfG